MLTEVIREAYLKATNAWKGCDWTTAFGKHKLDLRGCTAAEANSRIKSCSGTEAEDWRAAATWLAEIESIADEAGIQGSLALAAASAGDMVAALHHAENACDLERKSGRLQDPAQPPTWEQLRTLIEIALHTGSGSHVETRSAIPTAQSFESVAEQLQELRAEVAALTRRIEQLERSLAASSAAF